MKKQNAGLADIKYPRRTLYRAFLRVLARMLLRLLSCIKVTGRENIPTNGPVLLSGNHSSSLEAALMMAYSPRQVEFMGAGDIPFEPEIAWITSSYGFIPVNRGNYDREAIRKALSVLEQDGSLAIFPEGGTWEPGKMQAQIGVALLSQRSGAPVVPVGFSGMRGAIGQALKLKRPKIEMRIGKPIPALKVGSDVQSLKPVLQDYADEVLRQIYELVTEEDKLSLTADSSYTLSLKSVLEGEEETLTLEYGQALAQMLFSEVILETYKRNLRMPVEPLYPSESPVSLDSFEKALLSIQELLKVNPAFLTFRFGNEKSKEMVASIAGMLKRVEEAETSGKALKLTILNETQLRSGERKEEERVYTLTPRPVK
ncbi:MAG: lysophospholipid acyltransferase family protein [Anaerolineaceae bacterium]